MNDPLIAGLSESLAERVRREAGSGSRRQQLAVLYELTLGRFPTNQESEIGLQFLSIDTQPDPLSRYCHLIFCTNEFLFVD